MAHSKTKISIDRRQVLFGLAFILALYVFLPQFSAFKNSWHVIGHLNASWTLLAIWLTLTTYLFAALTYRLLTLRPLRYREVVIVQFAAMLVNRLLPAGIGGLGANYAYLHHRRHNATQAATVVAVNNLLGLLGHGLIILLALLLSSSYSRHLATSSVHKSATTAWLVTAIIVIVGFVSLTLAHKRLKRTFATINMQMSIYRRHPLKLSGALLSSMMLTLCNMLCLYSCMIALGVHLPFIVVVLIFSFGLGAGTVTPTPGGLGGFEAGLFAGFVAYHVGSAPALAIALLFRLISYWLVLLPGLVAFIIAQQRHLFGGQQADS